MGVDPLLVVVGPTASGKSRLGLEVAEALDGEVVSADAFAVYRGLDIGTDKPGPDARRRVKHHMIDIADPRETYSAGDYAKAATSCIREITSRGKLPVVVGGTHFYVRALLQGLFPSPPRDPDLRARLTEAWNHDPQGLRSRLGEVDPEASARIAPADRQRILRALEVFELTGTSLSDHWKADQQAPRYRPLLAAPKRTRAELYAKIEARVDSMFASGLVEEVSQLLAFGVPREAHALKAIGYREVAALLEGKSDLAAAGAATKRASRKLAKRQLSWLRHLSEGELQWVPPAEMGGARELVALWDNHRKGNSKR